MKIFNCIKRKLLLIKLIWKEDDEDMANVYGLLIIKGLRTFESVPSLIKQDVAQSLINMEVEYLVPEEYLPKGE